LCPWEKWITQRQTLEDFNCLPWNRATAFGVICGTKLNNGLFLGVIDFDVKNVTPKAIEKGKKVLKELPITMMDETPSKGQHLIYWTRSKPKTIRTYHNEAAIEQIGEHAYCIMPPSQNYKRLNDNPSPTVVNDLEDLLFDALYSVGVKGEKENSTWFERKEVIGQS
jgi:hypothetical protein